MPDETTTRPARTQAARDADALRTIARNMRAEGHGGSRPDVLDEIADRLSALPE